MKKVTIAVIQKDGLYMALVDGNTKNLPALGRSGIEAIGNLVVELSTIEVKEPNKELHELPFVWLEKVQS